jgi:ATPase subunit of ABC transporter with duplicated ATPase domains
VCFFFSSDLPFFQSSFSRFDRPLITFFLLYDLSGANTPFFANRNVFVNIPVKMRMNGAISRVFIGFLIIFTDSTVHFSLYHVEYRLVCVLFRVLSSVTSITTHRSAALCAAKCYYIELIYELEGVNMISANNVTLRIGKKALFEDVNIKFTEGNCYGLIGANGAGKSTFLKILSGQLDTTNGDVSITPGQRLSVLEQDHFKYDEYPVIDVVIMGNERLYQIMKEKDAIYAKEDFSDEDGIRASELEAEFAEMDGWEAESNAASLLNGLGIGTELHYSQMADLAGNEKVKVLLAKALFGNPDILLLDEPTNHLDLDAIAWLEEFLIDFNNTVIVVSHDRYFLNKVCTHTADIDYGKIQLYAGNYDFWYESSQLLIRQMKEANKKKEEKIKELQEFISRFSANASKSKQATSRKRALEKIELDEIKPSSRKYPYIDFRPEREIGNEVLTVEGISKTLNGEKILDNISFIVGREDKIAFVGSNEIAKTTLFKILTGEMEPDAGSFKWGVTTSQAYFPKDNTQEFDNDYTITDWLMGYSPVKDVTYVRGFLGRMLFAGEDGVKKVKVLSGGEKVRCLLSKMMISGANCLIFDEPTNHLDMESITALNEGMKKFPGVELFSCHDHQVVQTTANRIMEILPDGTMIDKVTTYDEYLASDEMARKRTVYTANKEDDEN